MAATVDDFLNGLHSLDFLYLIYLSHTILDNNFIKPEQKMGAKHDYSLNLVITLNYKLVSQPIGIDRSRYEEEEEEDGSSTDKYYQSESDIDEDAVTD